MIVIPAIDLREGACVQLVGGHYDDERVRIEDPLTVARDWAARGFRRLHVVDLDAATGRGDNAAAIHRIVAEPGLEIQVGGGVRDAGAIGKWLAAGAARVIVGTRAIEDPEWLAAVAAEFPEKLVVAADVRERDVLAGGWSRPTGLDLFDSLSRFDPLPLAGLLVTAVHREGRLAGADLDLMERVARGTRLPLFAAGGIASAADLASLDRAGCHAAVIGMALYTGALDPQCLKEYAS